MDPPVDEALYSIDDDDMELLEEVVQMGEVDGLPSINFSECGTYGHTQELCPKLNPPIPDVVEPVILICLPSSSSASPIEPFGPWMIVERKQRRPPKVASNPGPPTLGI
ncbi:hypothetical protein V6N11_018862 [Hibiscus sabdariffa]|uniref:Uncharacterized protein n=1 Tax=Hibiscus sabdariffa TaxID=183260 RepID=A0ABR2N675_9ROSI